MLSNYLKVALRLICRERMYTLINLLGLTLALGVPLLAVILWLMQESGAWWWLWAWLVWMGFTLFITWAYPTFLAPLFNKFQPLADEALRQRLETLLERCGFQSDGMFVMDGSRRSAPPCRSRPARPCPGSTSWSSTDRAAARQGVELEEAEVAARRGVEVVASFDEIAGRGFDLLLTCHVLEHVAEPAGMIHRYLPLLKDGGVVFVEVPSIELLAAGAASVHALIPCLFEKTASRMIADMYARTHNRGK